MYQFWYSPLSNLRTNKSIRPRALGLMPVDFGLDLLGVLLFGIGKTDFSHVIGFGRCRGAAGLFRLVCNVIGSRFCMNGGCDIVRVVFFRGSYYIFFFLEAVKVFLLIEDHIDMKHLLVVRRTIVSCYGNTVGMSLELRGCREPFMDVRNSSRGLNHKNRKYSSHKLITDE